MKATKRPFLSLIDSRGPARSVSGSDWAWTDADHLELNGYDAQDLQAQDRNRNHCDTPQDRRQQLDRRALNTLHSRNSAPGYRISLLRSR